MDDLINVMRYEIKITISVLMDNLAKVMESIPVRMLQAVDEAFLITQQRLGGVNSSDPATFKSVHLAFFKFHYEVEMIHPVLEVFPQET